MNLTVPPTTKGSSESTHNNESHHLSRSAHVVAHEPFRALLLGTLLHTLACTLYHRCSQQHPEAMSDLQLGRAVSVLVQAQCQAVAEGKLHRRRSGCTSKITFSSRTCSQCMSFCQGWVGPLVLVCTLAHHSRSELQGACTRRFGHSG